MPKEESTEMINFYKNPKMKEFLETMKNPHYKDHLINCPFRMLVVAASGGGKTTFVLNMLQKMTETFYHIHVVHKCDESIYSFLEKQLGAKRITFYKSMANLPLVNSFPHKGKPQLVIFDDQVAEPEKTQELISEFYI